MTTDFQTSILATGSGKTIINFVSNFHDSEETTGLRKQKNGTKSTVKDYNAYMGGVDTADRLRALYCVDRKTPK